MAAGQEYHFYTMVENGHKFICVDCGPEITDSALAEAMELIQKSGMKVVQNDD